jgi:hypothetical protein
VRSSSLINGTQISLLKLHIILQGANSTSRENTLA